MDTECAFEDACELPGDERHVGNQLRTLEHMLKKQMSKTLQEYGMEAMPIMQVWIMEYLEYNGGNAIYQKDIEKNFRVGKSTLAAVLKAMEEKGYISRLPVKGDARLKRVCLTETGHICRKEMAKAKEALEQKTAAGISKEDMDTFFRVIRHMQENLST